MAQISVMESKVPIKSSAEDFYKIFSKENHLIPKMCPSVVKDIKLVEGEWNSVGSKKNWIFVPGGSVESCTLEVVDMNDTENSITYKAVDGDLTEMYSTFKFTVQAQNSTKGNGSDVNLTIHFEKKKSDVPDPTKYREFAKVLYEGIGNYLAANPLKSK